MTDDLMSWLGHRRELDDQCALPLAQRVAALLDHDPWALQEGEPLPQGWHICLFTPRICQSNLREDGHAQHDPLMPPAPLPRRMLGGRRCEYLGELRIGAQLHRVDEIVEIQRKNGSSGEMVIITTRHTVSLRDTGEKILIEEQDSIYRAAPSAAAFPAKRAAPIMPEPQFEAVRKTDPALLFRFSAVTFNTHRIHYDLPYATGTEGYPGLIVNGGLMSLLLMDLFRRETGEALQVTDARNRAAVFGGMTLRLKGAQRDEGWLLWIEEVTNGNVIMEMTAK